jgi:hypothetical protein
VLTAEKTVCSSADKLNPAASREERVGGKARIRSEQDCWRGVFWFCEEV